MLPSFCFRCEMEKAINGWKRSWRKRERGLEDGEKEEELC